MRGRVFKTNGNQVEKGVDWDSLGGRGKLFARFLKFVLPGCFTVRGPGD